ncbi:MAG: thiamine phosphate synthase [Bacteroidaceae bacterium]|nr:thiamine phosphate synthase [Bacteroidaceae bacterium]
MKLILQSSPEFFIEEHQILMALFDEGLELVHLSKPNSEPIYCERLLSLMPDSYRKNIVTHDHFYLKNEYALRGIHLNHPDIELPHNYKGPVSCTVQDIEDVPNLKKQMDYLFLPNVYEYPEPHKFATNYNLSSLKELAKKKIIDKKVFLKGCVELENIEQIKEIGFGGVVINGAIWDRFDIQKTQDFKDLINHFRKLSRAATR